ncbi:hypothetical protein [Actinacidiphila oryziradicis]|nr:hypothetical protein [Actinacidiphila oryziradicis]
MSKALKRTMVYADPDDLGHRDFRTVRPLTGHKAFRLLPADR